jgi:hypothetical protein
MAAQNPITSGFRLALSFSLVHTTNSPQPSLATADQSTFHLRRVLLAWSQAPDCVPDKVILMLEDHYPKPSTQALEGCDAQLFAILDHIASDLGMCLGFVDVQHVQQGSGRDRRREMLRSRRGYCNDSSDDDAELCDDDDVEMDEIDATTTTMRNLVDADGKVIRAKFDFDDRRETIPHLRHFFDDKTHDEQEYEGWQGDVRLSAVFLLYVWTKSDLSMRGLSSVVRVTSFTLTTQLIFVEVFNRTALVIWPRSSKLGIGSGADRRCAFALETLQASMSPGPTGKEAVLFEYAMKYASELPKGRALSILCGASRRWKNRTYWERSLGACAGGRSGNLSLEEVKIASSLFGFATLTAACVLFPSSSHAGLLTVEQDSELHPARYSERLPTSVPIAAC